MLSVDTGRFVREWRWCGNGFSTTAVRVPGTGVERLGDAAGCDWQLPDGSEPDVAVLRSLTACESDDEGFTHSHIRVTAVIDYPSCGWSVAFEVWCYPDAPGLRTQLRAKRLSGGHDEQVAKQGIPPDYRIDRVPLGGGPVNRRRLVGYFNETQQRNETHLDLLKEEVIPYPLQGTEWCDWASAFCVESETGGIALVKESHKCVNQRGHATGGFECDSESGLACTGWGVRRVEGGETEFVPGWATWCLGWAGGDLAREVAFKDFDSLRYPFDAQRDVYVQANTWGSTETSRQAPAAAWETSVLEELNSCADLGIDILQIDDGWQAPEGDAGWQPGENGWRPHPERYPEGWRRVRRRAEGLGVKLGLWAAAQSIGLDELLENFREGGFVQYKLDFANLRSRAEIEELMSKVRAFVLATGHTVRVNWDVTENAPRYGYFFGREYGCIYLENRKPTFPLSTVYRPHTVLRDLWQIAKYLNLNRFQCSIQNLDRVDRERSDAHLHSHGYAVAIALMGIPLFFQQTVYYDKAARDEIRPILEIYCRHRERILRGMVHPIGDKPDNGSWTGFQCRFRDEEDAGYVTLFRERCNGEPVHDIRLHWTANRRIRFRNLLTGEEWEDRCVSDGGAAFRIDAAPGFLFLEYRVTGV